MRQKKSRNAAKNGDARSNVTAKANEHLEGDAHQPSVGEELRQGVQLEHGLLESMAGQRRNAGDEPRFAVEAVPTSIRVLVPAQEVVLDVLKLTK